MGGMDPVSLARQVDQRLHELKDKSNIGTEPWCYDCQSDFKNLMFAGQVLLGCPVCWAKTEFRGPPPQNASIHDGRLCPRTFTERALPGLEELQKPKDLSKPKILRRSSTSSLLRRHTVDAPNSEGRRPSKEGVSVDLLALGSQQLERRQGSKDLPPLERNSLPTIAQRRPSFLDVTPDEILVRDDERAQQVFGKLAKKPLQDMLDSLVDHLRSQNLSEEQLFDRLDANHDGQLTREEMRVGLRKMGCMLRPVELDAVLRAFDTDGNGTIDFQEFISLMQSRAAAVPKETKVVVSQDAPAPGFVVGVRVRRAVQLPGLDIDNSLRSLGEEESGVVVGAGEGGTVQCDFNGLILNMKPNQLALVGGKQRTVRRSSSFAGSNRRRTL